MRSVVLILVVLITSGCANRYSVPRPNIDNAQLRLVSIPSNNNFVTTPNNNECIDEQHAASLATLGLKANLVRRLSRIDMPLYNHEISDSHQNEVYIPAGREFTFQFNGVGITGIDPGKTSTQEGILYSWCRKLVSFIPEKNRNYEAVYDYITTDEGRETCGVTLFELAENDNGQFHRKALTDYQVKHHYCPL
ncbi:hypothetical protein [uncultured Shewanella sp.]|uniref:hypothetical protein n=1 Tax=uncultured Shewanella sp. TaxID=173975 RepID=UPI0026054F17|nr:hypothetical protein [uncultured Shewanella sp.]